MTWGAWSVIHIRVPGARLSLKLEHTKKDDQVGEKELPKFPPFYNAEL
jgi:hypothetical protein